MTMLNFTSYEHLNELYRDYIQQLQKLESLPASGEQRTNLIKQLDREVKAMINHLSSD
jgi:hypothetical protein